MDQATESAAADPFLVTTVGASALGAQEDKPATNLNLLAQAPSLKFLVTEFYSEDPNLWFWQLEATFTVNRVMTKKDKHALVISNLPFKVVCHILRTVASKERPYTVLKELVVKETDLSDYQWSEKLHALPTLGDQRPSELLTSIRNLQPVQGCGCYCARYNSPGCLPSGPSW